jgi:hypothetical protein
MPCDASSRRVTRRLLATPAHRAIAPRTFALRSASSVRDQRWNSAVVTATRERRTTGARRGSSAIGPADAVVSILDTPGQITREPQMLKSPRSGQIDELRRALKLTRIRGQQGSANRPAEAD